MNDEDPIPGDWTSGIVHANGIDLHYRRTGGDGPPLVVAHGVFDDGACRAPLARDLEGEYDVILPDARGHGHSEAPETGYDPGTQAADLLGLVDTLEIDDPYLFGHSMGADTVAAAAARRPDLPRGVVMEDPAAMLQHDSGDDEPGETGEKSGEDDESDEGEGEGASGWNPAERVAWWHDHTKAGLLERDDELRGHVEAGKEALASLLADARLRVSPHVTAVFASPGLDPTETYSRIEAQTLILKADADESGRERDRETAADLPDGRLVHVEGADHCVFRNRRREATRELRAFLAEN